MITPFSEQLKSIRIQRGLKQNQMAQQLGVEQSYLSALECGHKPPPKNQYLDHLIQKLGLDVEEAESLRRAAKKSTKTIKIPPNVKKQTQEMCLLLEETLPRISDSQVQVIKLVLEFSQEREMEASKM